MEQILEIPEKDSVWVHNSGREYRVTCITNLYTVNPERYPITVVYVGANGNIWSRPLFDWQRSMTKKDKS
ncbi:hypothetical protein [Marinobacterium litorale]|uniref:hypothetical protein n=1 Tax=Marinobacterium litorale TaxID=404770 RepID=UPI001B7FAFAB|nr:hypothetical protein [Marinobacterium litorale]